MALMEKMLLGIRMRIECIRWRHHFALDEKNDEIASLILAFLAKHPS
jgi:hypothetical protein